MRVNFGAASYEIVGYLHARGVSKVVCAFLEGESEKAYSLPAQGPERFPKASGDAIAGVKVLFLSRRGERGSNSR